MSKWISVKDRLPELNSWVIVADKSLNGDFYVTHAQLRSIDEEGYAEFAKWRMPDGGPIGSLWNVDYWMPLPKPPKEQS